MTNASFIHQHRVTYAMCTVGNHIYYGRYLDLLEEARGEFFRSLGAPLSSLQSEGVLFPVRECWIRYENSARYDEILNIKLRIAHLDRLWLKLEFDIQNSVGDSVATGRTDHVCTDQKDKPRRMPKPLHQRLQAYAHDPDQANTCLEGTERPQKTHN